MRKIVDGYWWVIKEIPIGSGSFCVIKFEPSDSQNGCANPETIAEKMSKEEAIRFLEEKFNESRNKK